PRDRRTIPEPLEAQRRSALGRDHKGRRLTRWDYLVFRLLGNSGRLCEPYLEERSRAAARSSLKVKKTPVLPDLKVHQAAQPGGESGRRPGCRVKSSDE